MFTALSLRKQAQFCESRARTCKPRFGGGPRPAHLGLKRCTVRQEGTYRGRGDESYTFRGDCSHARRSRPSLASWLETGGVEDVSLGVGDFSRASALKPRQVDLASLRGLRLAAWKMSHLGSAISRGR